MEISLVYNKDEWDAWLLSRSERPHFLQSWEWGECLKAAGQRVERLAATTDGETLAQAQVAYKRLPLGWEYAVAPKGPLFAPSQELSIMNQGYKLMLAHLQKINCIFFRCEPLSAVHNSRFMIRAVRDIYPPATLILDIAKSEDELFAAMRQKTRYNIRLAQKRGLIVKTEKDFETFWRLMQKTGVRDNFILHSKESYRAVLASSQVHQLAIFFSGEAVATGCFFGFGNTFYYLYGASNHEYRQLMGPHLAQWEAIKLAKRLGYERYDFFGIAPRKHDTRYPSERRVGLENDIDETYQYDPNHRYAGVTRFKIGFGGKIYEDPGTFDLIISPKKYKLYQLLRRIRRFF